MTNASSNPALLKLPSLGASEVISALHNRTLLITATPRQAAEWKRQLITAANTGIVTSPAIVSWQQWLEQLAANKNDIPVPLNTLQELQLWERVIRDEMRGQSSASARGLARHASKAYSLMRKHLIDPRELKGLGDEAETLHRWITAIIGQVQGHDRMLMADLPEWLLPHIAEIAGSEHILLDGFDTFTPLQLSLLHAMQTGGIHLETLAIEKTPASISVTAYPDTFTEYRHVARQISEIVQHAPETKIAVAISRQVNDIETLYRILDEILLPSDHHLSMKQTMQAVVTAGIPLSERPLIRQLLDTLKLAGAQGCKSSELSPLLFSPGIKGYVEERLERAGIDASIREQNRHYISFTSLQSMAEAKGIPHLADVAKQLSLWQINKRHSAGEWIKSVHTFLQGIGFLQAESAGRESGEIRQLNAFRDCLTSLIAVDAVSEPIGWQAFLSLLVSVCSRTTISATPLYPNISVVTLEQLAGQHFDLIFALGIDEEALPKPVQPIALLPFSLQRRHALPGSTSAIAFAESERLWSSALQAAPHLHVSFARSREEQQLGPSPFLSRMEVIEHVEPEEAIPTVEMETFADAPNVPLTAHEKVSGGSAIIKQQSLCPFRAFASHRLGIAPLGETEPGIDAAAKGSLIHHALQYIWESIRSQHALLELNESEVESLLDSAVEHAWQESRVGAPESIRRFEKMRMRRVLGEWLELERGRPPFKVERCEKAYRLELPQTGSIRFPVTLKADRIDIDSDGRKILIDYKTGQKQSIGKWIGERMAEPQLPLYAMAENLGPDDAVCFARVRSGDMGFEGLCGEEAGIKGISAYKGKDDEAADWSELLECWRRRIDALAQEFVEGRSDVTPQDAHACDYCGLEALCRIDEIGIDRDDARDDDSEEAA